MSQECPAMQFPAFYKEGSRAHKFMVNYMIVRVKKLKSNNIEQQETTKDNGAK